MTVLIIAVAVIVFAVLSFTPAIRRSEFWRATVTPLASIMGSGFLICASLLASVVGNLSPLVMAALLGLSWLIGGAIRFNIRCIGDQGDSGGKDPDSSDDANGSIQDHRLHQSHQAASWLRGISIEKISHWVLAVAYLISVTYYIKLLAQFSLDRFGMGQGLPPKILATVVLASIAGVGFAFGLKVIERIEGYAINLNLAMIAALLAALAVHNFGLWRSGDWQLPDLSGDADRWTAFRTCLGLLIVVQGFETSRFLGSEHSAAVRARTMNAAQTIAAVIYLVFLGLMLVVMTPDQASTDAGVTAIVTLAAAVAAVLPLMITIAAVGSQFSAAVADTAGCGGLLASLSDSNWTDWLTARRSYLLIGGVTIAMVWSVDVLSVIAYASRAFAAFYALQCWIAARTAWRAGSKPRGGLYAVLVVVCVAVTVLGKSSGG